MNNRAFHRMMANYHRSVRLTAIRHFGRAIDAGADYLDGFANRLAEEASYAYHEFKYHRVMAEKLGS